MKIALLTNSVHAAGGAARIVDMQKRLLSAHGHAVRIFCPDISWFSSRPAVRFMYHLADLRPQSALVDELVAWKPDALISHNVTGCGIGTPAMARDELGRTPWIHVLHDVQLFEPSGQIADERPITAWQMFWGRLRRGAFKRPDLVVSPTAWLLHAHTRRHFFRFARTRVLANPVPLALMDHPIGFRSPPVIQRTRPLRLLYVGRVSPDKGSGLLIQLARALTLPYELHVVGSGPDEQALCHASPAVLCHGERSSEDVEKRMREADILLVPSQIEENQPTVILEAGRLGLPIIASPKGGIPETLQGAGILLSPEDPSAWIKAIDDMRYPYLYVEQVEKMDQLACRHDPERYIQELEKIIVAESGRYGPDHRGL